MKTTYNTELHKQ